jgi:DNA-binding Lrp family transcriptional regulator
VFSQQELAVIQALQAELPLCSRPYRAVAEQCGLDERQVLEILQGLVDRKVVRRVGAALNHRLLGYLANAMVLWQVPPGEEDLYGRRLAAEADVTHCYRRQVPDGWPCALFTMVHAHTRRDCLDKIRRISTQVGLENYQVLFSTREFKKTVMRYRAPR